MSTSSCRRLLFFYLTMLNINRIIVGKDTENNSTMTKQASQVKSALCKINSKLMQTVSELNELKTELNATRLSLNVLRIQLEKEIAQDRQDINAIQKKLEKLLAIGNQQMQNQPMQKMPDTSQRPRDCSDVRALGHNATGIYSVYPDSKEKQAEMDAYCDFSSQHESWLVFQRRKDGSENFDRRYSEYERGFGNLTGEFWLGNEKLHLLTSGRKYKLHIELTDFQGSKKNAEYSIFSIDSAINSYRLNIGGYSGTAGDSLAYHNGMKFTARDVDNDPLPGTNCASTLKGGWWYKTCHASNLNGLYLGGRHNAYGTGIIWDNWHGFFYSLKSTEMKIAPK